MDSGVNAASLNGKLAALEDEMKIVKGEVKQVLSEIRTAILAKENPFEGDSITSRMMGGTAVGVAAGGVQMSAVQRKPPRIELVIPENDPRDADEDDAADAESLEDGEPEEGPASDTAAMPSHSQARQEEIATNPAPNAGAKEPTPMPQRQSPMPFPAQAQPAPLVQPRQREAAQFAPQAAGPIWSLLTVASLAAWAEEAMRRVGSLRLEILLDLCEASGYLPAEARTALARVTELDIPAPEQPPTTTDTVVLLRQLDALLHDERDHAPLRVYR